jgi:hypothetical protein|nr:MAG TPA: Single strand DNA binding protein [Caudoviricetes sp.]
MSYQSRFSFCGTPVIPKQKADTKRPFCKEISKKDEKTKETKKMLSMTFGIKETDMNMAFVEAFDSQQKVIKTMDVDNEKMDVDWDDRFDEDIIEKVANYRKYIVDLGDEHGGRQEFITAYDMIEHLREHLPNYDGRVVVTGQFTRDWYAKKKTYFSKFRIQNVFAAPEERKNRLLLTMDLFYNKSSLDDSDFDENKKMTLDCYIEQYINKDEGRKYVPIQVVFSGAKYDLENEKHKKLFDYKMKYIKVKNKNMVHIPWEIVLLRGAEEAEFDESMLTDSQREQVELGIKSVDDFRPKGNIYGDRIDEFRLFEPKLEGDYADGVLECDDTADEFEEKIFVPAADETMEEAKKNSKSAKSKSKKDEDDDDDEPPFDKDEDKDDVDEEDLF